MTLVGILKHMALVEYGWFSRSLHGREYAPPWDAVDWKADPDWEWRTAAEDSPEGLSALWQRAVEQSRADVAEVLDSGDGLGRLAKRAWPDGRSPSLRWILCHMIEEYATTAMPTSSASQSTAPPASNPFLSSRSVDATGKRATTRRPAPTGAIAAAMHAPGVGD